MMLYGPGINPNTFIVANLAGTGAGSTWTVNQSYAVTTPAAQQVTGTGVVLSSVFTGSIVAGTGLYLGSGVLTTTSVASGTIQIGQLITGTNVAAGTYITGNISATSWTVSISQVTASTTITGNGFISITSAATATGSNITFTLIKGQPAIQFVNDLSTPGNPSQLSLTNDVDKQPRYISISKMTVQTATGSNTCLQLDAVRNSSFEDLKLRGGNAGNGTTFNKSSVGMTLNALSSLITCENNLFRNIEISNFTFGVYSYQDILNNIFDNCYFKTAYQGFVLGYVYPNQYDRTVYFISTYTVTGQVFGPRQTQINNCKFYNIYKQAVFLGWGSGNTVESPKLVLVGNDGGGEQLPTSTQLYFKSSGNSIENMYSDRSFALSLLNITTPYIPEAAGWVEHKSFGIASKIPVVYSAGRISVGQLVLGQLYTIAVLGTTNNTQWNTIAGTVSQNYLVGSTFRCAVIGTGLGNGTVVTPTLLFRLPVSTDEVGNPNGSTVYVVDYTYVSTAFNFVRRGTMTISADVHNIGGTSYVYPLQLSDEFDFAGTDSNLSNGQPYSLQLDFSAVYLDAAGGIYDPTDLTPPSSIQIQYNNLLTTGTPDAGSFTYLYSVTYTQPY